MSLSVGGSMSDNIVLNPARYNSNSTPPASLVDRSRYHNNGVFTNVTQVRLPSGKWLYSFNGASSRITITDSPSIQNIFITGGTILIWINPLSDGENDVGRIIDKSDLATLGFYSYVYDEVAGYVKLGLAVLWTGGWATWESDRVIPLNKYSHIGITYNGSNVANNPIFTLNGNSITVTETLAPVGAIISDASENLRIGDNTASAASFDGFLHPLKVSKRVLSVGEIRNNFESEKRWFGII
jgi:hypothetical protein